MRWKMLGFPSACRQAVAGSTQQGPAADHEAVLKVNVEQDECARNWQRAAANHNEPAGNTHRTCKQPATKPQGTCREPAGNPQGTGTRLARMDSQRPQWCAEVSRGQARESAQARSEDCPRRPPHPNPSPPKRGRGAPRTDSQRIVCVAAQCNQSGQVGGGATSAAWKPQSRWLRSQEGRGFDWPQRHRATVSLPTGRANSLPL